MNRDCVAPGRVSPVQFSVASLFECVTLCAVMAAFSGAVGLAATGFLMAMVLALGAGQGLLVLALLAASVLSVDCVSPSSIARVPTVSRDAAAILVMVLAGLLAAWYAWRRNT